MAERSRTKDEPRGTDESPAEEQNGFKSILDELPVDRLKSELQGALSAAAERTAVMAADKISDLTDKLTDVASNSGVAGSALAGGGKAALSGGSPLMGALKGGLSGVKDKVMDTMSGGSGDSTGSGGKNPVKATTIIESIDVGVPIELAYNQWTQFQDFSGFMKKVERVEQKSDEKLDFKAKILWSHRSWEATILEQVPEDKIVWRSKGEKGHVDGAVTFHELAPNLTRVVIVLEYYPQGLFERVGNIWRAQGRRARVELKHFQRHVMTHVILDPDKVEGWRGEIHRGKVQSDGEQGDDVEGDEDELDDEYADEYDDEDEGDEDEGDEDEAGEDEDGEGQPADEYDEESDEDEDADEDEDVADEDDLEDEYDDEEPADEYEDDEEDEDVADEDEDLADEDEDLADEDEDLADEDEDLADEDEDLADEDEDLADEDEAGDDEDDELAEDEAGDEDLADEDEDLADEDEDLADEDEDLADEDEDLADEDEELADEDEADEDDLEDEYDDEEPADEYEDDYEDEEYEEEPDERPRRRAS